MWSEEKIQRNPIIEAMRSAVQHVDELEAQLNALKEEKRAMESEYGACNRCNRADGKRVVYRPFWNRDYKAEMYLCPECVDKVNTAIDMVRDVLYKDDEGYQRWRGDIKAYRENMTKRYGTVFGEPKGPFQPKETKDD